MDDDDDTYANKDIFDSTKLYETLKGEANLEPWLKDDLRKCEANDQKIAWFHGKINRENAEAILTEAMQKFNGKDGLFLVRANSKAKSDLEFVLSLTHHGQIHHYQILEKYEGHFCVDQRPVKHGIENFIRSYTTSANGLLCALSEFIPGKPPPHIARKAGNSNILHIVVEKGDLKLTERVINSPSHPDINAKDELGSSALHIACHYGYRDIVELLLARDANHNLKDRSGHTPLHRACVGNQPETIDVLVKAGVNLQSKCATTGWVPLHEAAFKGHTECVQKLLNHRAPHMPRTIDEETPLDLTIKYKRDSCRELLENYVPPVPFTNERLWFHPELSRQAAHNLLESHSFTDGLFIVRKSSRQEGWHVLCLCHNNSQYMYEIKCSTYRNKPVHLIDAGPYFDSLTHLVQNYSYFDDGLPCKLVCGITRDGKMEGIQTDEEYYNIEVTSPSSTGMRSPNIITPPVIKRPDDLPKLDGMKNIVKKKPSATPPPVPNHPPPLSSARVMSVDDEPENNIILRDKLRLGSEIGQGEYGSVLKGVLTVSDGGKNKKVNVAVKTFHSSKIESQNDFLREAHVMQKLKHPCIVNLLGVCKEPQLMLVEEYIALGSMLDFLVEKPEKIDVKVDLYLWAAQIAAGMMYLEEKRLVHRDLAARNILLESMKQSKISDFGLSRAVGSGSDYYKASAGGRWPIKWYAPECVNYGQFSHASDVWSYGVTLWEMFSFGDPPYEDMKGIEVLQMIENGKRLEKPAKCPDHVYNKMLQCWNRIPAKRPSFTALNQNFTEDPEYASIQDTMKHSRKVIKDVK